MREKSPFPVFQVPQVSPVLQVSRLPPAVPARAQWSAHTHASEPARHHVANVAKVPGDRSLERGHVALVYISLKWIFLFFH